MHRYAVRLVEDPCAEDDRAHYAAFRAAVARRVRSLATISSLPTRHASARPRDEGLIDAALIKPNQSGTVSGARAALDACSDAGVVPIVSARSGETEDASIVHLAVGWQAPMIKVGSITRGERTAKWNEGIRIAEQLHGGGAIRPLPKRHCSHTAADRSISMQFAIYCLDKANSLDLRMATRNAHLAYMDTKPIDIVLAGPLAGRRRRHARFAVHRRS